MPVSFSIFGGPHFTVPKGSSCLCAQGSLLEGSQGPPGVSEIKPRSALSKARALPAVLFLQSFPLSTREKCSYESLTYFLHLILGN